MSKVVIAFYKHKRERNSVKNTLFRFFDDAIKFLTHGPTVIAKQQYLPINHLRCTLVLAQVIEMGECVKK